MAVTDRAVVRPDSFGFVMMTPQLFINYKLKSVAHLPWRAFMYKAFNTFIDDAFAMVSPALRFPEESRYHNRSKKPSVGPQLIAMPTKHRVMTLRDDIVFFIYLYQRYLYPVDKTRPNEFGRAYEEEEEEEGSGAAEKQANPAAASEQEEASTADAEGTGQESKVLKSD